MHLRRVELENVLSFVNAHVVVDRHVTSLVGSNDVGKSNLLRALSAPFLDKDLAVLLAGMECQFADGPLEMRFYFTYSLQERSDLRSILRTSAELDKGTLTLCLTPEGVRLAWGSAARQGKDLSFKEFRDLAPRFFRAVLFDTAIPVPRGVVPVAELLESSDSIENRMLAMGNLPPETLADIADGRGPGRRALRDCAETLSEILQREWSQDSRALRILLDLHGENRNTRSLEIYAEDSSGAVVPLDARGDGLRWYIGFLTELHHRGLSSAVSLGALLLFDEPGNFLHPNAQADLARVFNEDLPRAGQQVIYTTHSPFMLDWSRPHQVRVLERGARRGSEVINKPYHSNDSVLRFWEPFRRSIGLYLGDLGLLGEKNLFLEGVTDQMLFAFLTRRAKDAGEPDLGLRQRVLTPFGTTRTLQLLVETALENDRPAAVLTDFDENFKQVASALSKGTLAKVPLFSIADFARQLFPQSDMTVEDIFDPAWYLEQVNDAYAAFGWYVRIDFGEGQAKGPIARVLRQAFSFQEWRDHKPHDFDKALVASFIASTYPSVDFKSLQIRYPDFVTWLDAGFGCVYLGRWASKAGRLAEYLDAHKAENGLAFGVKAPNQYAIRRIDAVFTSALEVKTYSVPAADPAAGSPLLVWELVGRTFTDLGSRARANSVRTVIAETLVVGASKVDFTLTLSGGSLHEYHVQLPPGAAPVPRRGGSAGPGGTSPSPGRLIGTVKWFDTDKGFGFIIPATGGQDVFVHYSDISMDGFRDLYEGQVVEFGVRTVARGLQATEVLPR